MSRIGQEDVPEVQEDIPKVWEGLGGPPGSQGGVERPSRRSRKGQEAH